MMKKQNFVQGAMILVVAGLITRGLGTIYRIFLSRIIGSEAIGLYQMAFPTMIMLITLVTAGLPIAISKLVAEAEAKKDILTVRKVLRISLMLVMIISGTVSLFFYLSIPFISRYLLTDQRVYYTLTAIVPIIPIISVSSVLRGYFQGRQNMIPSALSMIIETVFRMVSGIILSLLLLPYGIEYASAGAMIGMVIGELAGFITLVIQYLLHKSKLDRSQKKLNSIDQESIYLKIYRIAVPVTASQVFTSLAYFIEPGIVAHSLALAGVSTHMATAQYGQLAGMAILIISFPSVITYSLSVSLIPAVSEAAARKNMKAVYKRLHQALKIAYIIGIPSAVIMFVLADSLAVLLFNTPEVGKLIKIMAPFAVFLYLQRPLSATLQGLDRAKESMQNSIIGSIVKTVAILFLASKPEFGIDGVAMSINISMMLVTVLHFYRVIQLIGFSIEVKPILLISLSAFIVGYISHYTIHHSFLSAPFGLKLLLTVLISGVTYLYLLLFLKVIKKEDLERIPWIGTNLTRILP